ncbi:hypothetical protein [uncultured Dokdonia sp.]|uniref:hypothetical protein n=1 Tax=uncultured Dokdonia sp. TaxID=575653 RepID=UPI0026191597|nr:hypothetical protein [uncultured Dokdonia sp.]
MKNFMILSVFIVAFLSCDKDDSQLKVDSSNLKLETITSVKIGNDIDNNVTLDYSNSDILSTFAIFSIKNKLDLQPQSMEVIDVDSQKYLRIYSKDEKVSTIALIKDENGHYRTGETICTSSQCSSSGGCLPNGQYCTKCIPNPNSPLKGDCTRTTSSGGEPNT